MPHKMLFSALLLLLLSGCAVYGGGYDRGYHNGQSYRYYDGYRRDYYAPPVYVTPRYYYDDRRHQYHQAPPRYVPAPPPRHQYGHEQRYRDGYKRHEQPQHDYRRDQRRQEHRGGHIQRGWDAGRNTQQRFSSGRSHNEQRRSGERRR